MNIDLLLLQELQSLASVGNNDSDNNTLETNIPFGHIAFINEKFWKNQRFHKKSAEQKTSHPGLSISSTEKKVAFGTSRTDGRSNDKNIFWVSPKECDILKKTAVFLLSHWAPADIFQIDTRKADSVKSHKMLSKAKLSELKNAGYY